MYQAKRNNGATFFTTRNPNPSMSDRVKMFLLDKWWWLLSFNKPPEITINQDIVGYEGEPHVIEVDGRLTLTINGNLILKKKKPIHNDKERLFNVQTERPNGYSV